ncbi:28973_t:CDS:2, partial [Racocetra persica]
MGRSLIILHNEETNEVEGARYYDACCQEEWDNLKDWEVKKRDLMERDADNYCLNKHQGVGSFVDQAELTRLEQKLGVAGTPNYSPASEDNKKELEDQINTLLKGQK